MDNTSSVEANVHVGDDGYRKCTDNSGSKEVPHGDPLSFDSEAHEVKNSTWDAGMGTEFLVTVC